MSEGYINQIRYVVRRRFLRCPIVVLQILVEYDWREWRGLNLHVGTRYYWRDANSKDLQRLQDKGYLKDGQGPIGNIFRKVQ